jgi:pimeloyl-ACP methyl ester carboxylesterase
MALSQPALLGLPPETAAQMQPLVAKRYEAIATDRVFQTAPSSLQYCFSVTRPATGRALLYSPANTSAKTPTIVFIHGYGGSFIWYQHFLAQAFPNHIILCPAYGVSPANIPATYINEALAAATRHLGHNVHAPTLIGLSAGAFGAARIYAAETRPYARLVLLAACPPTDILASFSSQHTIHLLAGAKEVFVTDGSWTRTLQTLKDRRILSHAYLIPAADHFFLLTHPAESTNWLKATMAGP